MAPSYQWPRWPPSQGGDVSSNLIGVTNSGPRSRNIRETWFSTLLDHHNRDERLAARQFASLHTRECQATFAQSLSVGNPCSNRGSPHRSSYQASSLEVQNANSHICPYSSAGRASALQAEGPVFDPLCGYHKWCDNYNLSRKVSDIKKYTDEEWEKVQMPVQFN